MQISNHTNKPSFNGVFKVKSGTEIPMPVTEYVNIFNGFGNVRCHFFSDSTSTRFSVKKKFDAVVSHLLEANGIKFQYANTHNVRSKKRLFEVI